MHDIFLATVAFLPIAAAFYLNYVRVKIAAQSVPIVMPLVLAVAIIIWNMPLMTILAAFSQGWVWSAQLLLLLISVIFCTESLRATGLLFEITPIFQRVTTDRRIQVLLIAFLLGSGIQTLLGFGSTNAICALLLWSMGFPPWCAVMMGVMGPIMGGMFSSGGFPIFWGIKQGILPPQSTFSLGMTGSNLYDYLWNIVSHMSLAQGIFGIFYPVIMLRVMHHFFGTPPSWRSFAEIVPFALFCGIAFSLPVTLSAIFLGPEFPGLVGSVVGLALAILAIRFRFLIPRQSWDFLPTHDWPSTWTGGNPNSPPKPTRRDTIGIWLAFGLLGSLLVLLYLIKPWLTNFAQKDWVLWKNIFGSPIHLSFSPFFVIYSACLFVTGFLALATRRFPSIELNKGRRISIAITHAGMELLLTMPMGCLYIYSSFNDNHYPSMLTAIAQGIAHLPGGIHLASFLSPIFGGLISNVSSNPPYGVITITSFQDALAQTLKVPSAPLIGLGLSASYIGALFLSHHIASSSMAVEDTMFVSSTGRKMIPIMLGCLVFLGGIGFILSFIPKWMT